MMLEGSNASTAISWVREDLDACLHSIRENLEQYAEDPRQRNSLKIVQEQLEQLNLTFITMQQNGAVMLTDEMIAVGGNMLHNSDASLEESLSALSDAVIVLPSYLDRLQAGHDDLPILLLPTLNELRASYDESLLSEGTLFAPSLEVEIPDLRREPDDPVSFGEFPTFSKRMRSQYQNALLGWLREQSSAERLRPIRQVCQSLFSRLKREDLRRLWWIAAQIMVGIEEGAIDNDLPLRRVFARLDLNLKAMAEGGEAGPSIDSITALSRALLFHVAQARPGSKPIELLREIFRIDEIIPDRNALLRARGAVTGRDARLFHTIGEAIREEMATIKDALDMELRTGRIDKNARSDIVTSLIQLSDTLHMLELPVPAKALQQLLPALELTREVENFELDSPLLSLAQKLLEVESVLEKHIDLLGEPLEESEESGFISLPQHERRQILSHMLDEAVSSLHEAQEGIRERLEGDMGADYVTPLRHISGALFMAGQMEVSKLTEKLERALNAELPRAGVEEREPGVALMLLTDAVAALELYLTGCRDEQANSLRYLDIMQDRLEGLPEATISGEAVTGTVVSLKRRPAPKTPEPEPAQAAPATREAPAAAADQLPCAIDPNMQDVFLEEFAAVRAKLQESLQQWIEDAAQRQPLEEIRRGFHTLKGSGRMVGAKELGEFAWRIENLLNRVLEKKVDQSATITDLTRLAILALPMLKSRMLQQENELTTRGINALSEFARQLARGEKNTLQSLKDLLPPTLLAGLSGPLPVEPEAKPQAKARAAGEEIDPTLLQLMRGEIRQYLETLEPFVAALESGKPPKVTIDEVRTAHSLAGTLALSPLGDEPQLAKSLEAYLQGQSWANQRPTREAAPVLRACLDRVAGRLAVLEGEAGAESFAPSEQGLIDRLGQLTRSIRAGDREHIPEDKAEAAEAARQAAAAKAVEREEKARREKQRVAEERAAEAAKVPEVSEADELERLDREILGVFLGEAVDVLERCDTILNTWRDKLSDAKLVRNLQREIHTFKGGARMAGLEALGDLSHAMETLLERIAANRLEATVAAVQALEQGCDRLTIWVEMLQSGRLPEDKGSLKRFQRRVDSLVSIRPGMALPEAPLEAEPEVPEEAPAEAEAAAEEAQRKQAREAAAAAEAAERARMEAAEAKEAEPAPEVIEMRDLAQAPPIVHAVTEIDRLEEISQEFREISERAAGEEEAAPGAQIRVAAELMDSLINHSGEISIYRARLEEQLGMVRFNLKEVDQTVARLNDQLRKMDMETEAQMLSRYHHASSKTSSEFDPLELDRFSNIQQLSRALRETVSDLHSLHEMLDESVRQAENLLGQQSRASSELQDGLMQTRMTPFGSVAPRLRRVVRAAASETDKKARLQLRVAGSSDRLDRNVLERITAPLEHMLRNAVVHGIEPPKLRRNAGKPEEGEITVTVSAETTEFVIRVQDDGAGIDLDAIRKRAIDRGMIDKDDKLAPRQFLRFILESGFSTSNEVTALAGRGVGMDVVNSEIKQIGGSLEIATEKDKGSRFTIRIPFSLAVMQAIGVSVGGQPYLVPLNSVAGVGRISPADYAALIKRKSPTYEFAGEKYPVMELAALLGVKPDPLESENVSLLMVDTGELRAAFRISDLRGHQEVVIKSIGPQISSIPGILGGTISGDGRVVIILDIGPLIRNGASRALEAPAPAAEAAEEIRPPLIMVIDDSITMRKVTSRVLENHALKVVSAKDGVDAVEKLRDCVPDLILLDIEMPRMDGYELAEHVRSDSRLRKIPIIMVTSRAGQKHRKRARKLGANAYLTKPYQEAELIEQIGELLAMNLSRRGD